MNLLVFLIVSVMICVAAALSRFLAIRKEEKYKNGFGRKLNIFLFVVTLIICVSLIAVWLIDFLENTYISNRANTWFDFQMRMDFFIFLQVDKALILYFSLTYFLYSCRSREATIFHSVFSILDIFTILMIIFKTNGLLFAGAFLILAVIAFLVLPLVVLFQTVQNFIAAFRKPGAESDENDLQLQAKPKLKGVFTSVLLTFFCFVFAMIVFVINAAVLIPTPSLRRVQSFALDDETPEILVLEKEKRISLHHSEFVFYIYLKDGLFAKKVIGDIELEYYPKEYEVVWEEDEAKVRFIGKNKTNQTELLGEYTVMLNGGEGNG